MTWSLIIQQRTGREIESQADKHVVYLVRLHLDSHAGKQTSEESLRQTVDKCFLQVHCRFMQLRRQAIQTHCCCSPLGLKWKLEGTILFFLLPSYFAVVALLYPVPEQRIENHLRSLYCHHGEMVVSGGGIDGRMICQFCLHHGQNIICCPWHSAFWMEI